MANVEPIDLTLLISQKLPCFPGSPKPQFIPWSKIKNDGYNLELLFLSSHSGTHMDAPYHFVENGSKIHEISPNRLLCDDILIKIKKRYNEKITKNYIVSFEKKYGLIPNHSTIVFATGWQKNLQKPSYFKNNPGLAYSAGKYLVLKKINLVGIVSPSIDLGYVSKFPIHRLFSKKNILIVENLCNLEKISNVRFKLIVFPLKLKNATGSPVRAVAI